MFVVVKEALSLVMSFEAGLEQCFIGEEKPREETMTKVYCYAKCSTCKKALKWLDENAVEYSVIDIKGDHPDEKTLRELHNKSGLPLKRLFNTSGQLYREMELSKKLGDMSEDEMFRLLASDGMLVKRPLLDTANRAIPGFREEEWREALDEKGIDQ
jgi:arsenate reductase